MLLKVMFFKVMFIKVKPLFVFAVALSIFSAQTGAFWVSSPPGGLETFTTGYVYSRAQETGPNGAPIWAEYSSDGSLVREIGEAVGSLSPAQLKLMSQTEYQSYLSHLAQLKQSMPELSDADVYTKDEYQAANFVTLAAPGETATTINKPTLKPGMLSVVVMPQALRYLNDPDRLIVAQYPIDITDPAFPVPQSMLIEIATGKIIHRSENNRIGFKNGFFKGVDNHDFWRTLKKKHSDQLLGPISGAFVDASITTPAGAVTDNNGQFTVQMRGLPCFYFAYSYSTSAVLKMHSRHFNPRTTSAYPYYLHQPAILTCLPQVAVIPFFGPIPIGLGAVDYTPSVMHFPIDTTVVTGLGSLQNNGDTVEVAASTQYSSNTPASLSIEALDNRDFDGDGQVDQSVLGFMTPAADDPSQQVFKAYDAEATDKQAALVGIFLSGSDNSTDQPDFIRQSDWQANFFNEGLLDTISEADLTNTDVYIYRASDGLLIAERVGLKEQELGEGHAEVGISRESYFYYRMELRGSIADALRLEGRYSNAAGKKLYALPDFELWQSVSGVNPALYKQESDHVKPGDALRIVAINRATGYTGSVNTVLQSSSQASQPGDGNMAFHIGKLQLGPPNLKIWVERDYEIKSGLEQGEIRKDQIIGAEGAALASDKYIAIYSEWLDQNGQALPAELGSAGLTGRVAYLSGDRTLAGGGGGVHHFAIKPGRHIQVVKLPTDKQDFQHLYVQVSGQSIDGNPVFGANQSKSNTRADFSQSDKHPGRLKGRPALFTPFKVPVYDQAGSDLQWDLYQQQRNAADDPGTLTKPKPLYKWVYRPEMQFSIYDVDIKEINQKTDTNNDGQFDEVIDVTAKDALVSQSTDLLEILYQADITQYQPLDYFGIDGDKELILAIGEQEYKLQTNQQGQVVFDNMEHLSMLDADDYLTMSLYANNDAGNILWQFAFRRMIDLDIDSNNDNGYELPSLDDIEEELEFDYTGKILAINNMDVNDNSVPDFAEFDYGSAEARFVPVVLEVPENADLKKRRIVFKYIASDPLNVIHKIDNNTKNDYYLPAEGALRLWVKNANEVRNPLPYTNLTGEGDYIVPNKYYRLIDLGFSDEDEGRIKVFYIEAILASTESGDTVIKVELY